MEIIIKGEPKEIATMLLEVAGRQKTDNTLDTEPKQATNAKAIANLLLQRERILAKRKQQSQQCTQTDSPS